MRPDRCGRAGFTIVEVLAALAVLSTSLAAIGGLIATSSKGVRSVEQRVSLLQASRIITTGLPKRDEIAFGELDGEIGGYAWRLNVTPFFTDLANQASPGSWVPHMVAVSIRAPSGGSIRINTIRLVRRPKG